MMRVLSSLLVTSCLVTTLACGDDPVSTVPPLPENPQIQNPGFEAFPLLAPSATDTRNIVVANLGRQPLVLSNVALSGQDAGHFTLGATTYNSPATNAPTDSIGTRGTATIPITFNGASTGAYVATVTVTSNAENQAVLPIDVLVPVGAQSAPLLTIAEKSLTMTVPAGAAAAADTLRYYNLGQDSLVVTGYAFTGPNASSFSFADNTPQPGDTCRANQFDCVDPLFCYLATPEADTGTCAVSLSTGNLVVLDIYYGGSGNGTGTFTVTSSNGGTASVPMTGSR